MAAIRQQVVEALTGELRQLNADTLRKHAYTVAEVAEQIGYSIPTIRGFIREGRRGRGGKTIKLKARELTAGDYRILPADLDEFLTHF